MNEVKWILHQTLYNVPSYSEYSKCFKDHDVPHNRAVYLSIQIDSANYEKQYDVKVNHNLCKLTDFKIYKNEMLDYIESIKPVEDIGRVSFCDIFEIVKQSYGIMKILKIRNKQLMRDIFKKEFEVLDIIQHNQEYLATAE